MDFSEIFQTRTKKFWWMDVVLYFVISLLVATAFCYVIFSVENSIQRKNISAEILKLQTVGTNAEKDQEKEVIVYQGKINDFSNLLENHEFASNVFAFMQSQTMPNVWFKQFSLNEKGVSIQLSGESEDLDSLSRQVAVLEKNKYISSIGTLSSTVGSSARAEFNLNVVLNQSILNYLSDSTLAAASAASTPNSTPVPPATATSAPATGSATPETTQPGQAITPPAAATNPPVTAPSSEKLITSFHLVNPSVAGTIDETNYAVTLNVPYGTDVKNLAASIVLSPGATVLPASGVSQDFTSPVIYTVTAQDGSIQKYEVKVVVSAPVQTSKTSQSNSTILIILIIAGVVIVVIAIILLLVWKRLAGKKTNI